MNLLLLHDSDWRDDGLVQIDGRRSRHLRSVLRVGVGDEVRAGRLNGLVGTARILSMADGTIVLEPRLESDPPPRTGLELLLAMPRPKVLRRVLQSAASIGVDRIVLVNANRVEKSYFDSPFLHPDSMHEQLFLGLEQARDTRLPEVVVRNRFRPFVEDEAPGMWRESLKFVAHPDELPTPPGPPISPSPQRPIQIPLSTPSPRAVLAVGPEGGWVPFELELLAGVGFEPFSAGPRALRVEVAIPYLLGMLAVRLGEQGTMRPVASQDDLRSVVG